MLLVPNRLTVLNRILAASADLPTWTRWGSWVVTGSAVFLATAFWHVLWLPVTLGLAAFAAFANLPAVGFDGPLPFSSLGLHIRGEIYRWEEVIRVEPGSDPRSLNAIVVRDGRENVVLLRLRGARTSDEFRAALARHAPEKVAF
ncbi:MAG: hypothetical protein M3133_11440 [Actinomycetota bacterium]|nr:hypothetical protein [Actinomycetota bacterium]